MAIVSVILEIFWLIVLKIIFFNKYSILFAFVLFYKYITLTIINNIGLYFYKSYLH